MAGFTIPNELDAFHADQAEVDAKDLQIIADAFGGTGVITGCTVTWSAAMDVAVAAGTIISAGARAAVAGGNLTVGNGHATLPRFDLIVASAAGAKSVVAGAAAAQPVFPAIPAGSIVLGAVYVPATTAVLAANKIVDKRVLLLLTAAAISIADAGNDFTATTVEGALDELQGDVEALVIALADHLSDDADSHDASSISNVPAGSIAANTVQAALDELDAEKAAKSDPLGYGLVVTADPRMALAGAVWNANEARFSRITSGAATISKIGLVVTTASGNISVAVCTTTGAGPAAMPDDRIATSGAVACPAAGYAEVALSAGVAVTRGDWLGLSVDNATANFPRTNNVVAASDFGKGFGANKLTAHPIPDPVATPAAYAAPPLLRGVV